MKLCYEPKSAKSSVWSTEADVGADDRETAGAEEQRGGKLIRIDAKWRNRRYCGTLRAHLDFYSSGLIRLVTAGRGCFPIHVQAVLTWAAHLAAPLLLIAVQVATAAQLDGAW